MKVIFMNERYIPMTIKHLLIACCMLSTSGLMAQGSASVAPDEAWVIAGFEENPSSSTRKSKVLKSIPPSPLFSEPTLALETEADGRNQGTLKGFDAQGNLFFTVTYKKNKMDGAWQSNYGNGQRRDQGSFYRNVPDGEWRGYYANGNSKFVRQYSALKWFAINGEVKRRHPKLQHYPIASLAASKPDYFSKVITSGYSFNTLPAEASGYQPPFVQCLHHGAYINYYDNGIAKDSGYYKDGLRDGVWQERHENGHLKSSGFFINGQKHSGWTYYNNRGELVSLREYKFGELIHEKNYSYKTSRR